MLTHNLVMLFWSNFGTIRMQLCAALWKQMWLIFPFVLFMAFLYIQEFLKGFFDVIVVPNDWAYSLLYSLFHYLNLSSRKFSNVGLSCTWKVNVIHNTIFAGFSFIHLCKPGWTWHAWNNSCGPSRYHAWQDSRWSWTEDTVFGVLKNHATGNSAFGLQVELKWKWKTTTFMRRTKNNSILMC